MKAEKTHSLEDKISKSSITHVLPPLRKFSLYQGASLYFLLALLLARYSPLYLSLFYSLSHFFRRILPILVSPLTFLRVFLDPLYVFYFLFFWSLGLFLFISFSLKTQYVTLTLDTRICALYCRLPVFPNIQITHAIAPAHYFLTRPSIT